MANLAYRGLTLPEQQSTRGDFDRWTYAVDGVRILVLRERATGIHRVLCRVDPRIELGLKAGDARELDSTDAIDAAFAAFSTRAEEAKARPPRAGGPPTEERNAEIDAVRARVAALRGVGGGGRR